MKKVNFILPAIAFFLAIVASLASVNAKETLVDKRVSLPAPNACQEITTHHCATGGSSLCTNDSGAILREFVSAGTCLSPFNGTYEEDED